MAVAVALERATVVVVVAAVGLETMVVVVVLIRTLALTPGRRPVG